MGSEGRNVVAERARQVLEYCAATGDFRWAVDRSYRAKAGKPAGTRTRAGYISICIDGHPYSAHRLAWLITTGAWPDGDIDHINGIKDDNRLSNLRVVQQSHNSQNIRRPNHNNKTGLLGVWKNGSNFAASIKLGGKNVYLGTFRVAEEAHAAYIAAKRQLHPFGTI